jgi:hypothetical protein
MWFALSKKIITAVKYHREQNVGDTALDIFKYIIKNGKTITVAHTITFKDFENIFGKDINLITTEEIDNQIKYNKMLSPKMLKNEFREARGEALEQIFFTTRKAPTSYIGNAQIRLIFDIPIYVFAETKIMIFGKKYQEMLEKTKKYYNETYRILLDRNLKHLTGYKKENIEHLIVSRLNEIGETEITTLNYLPLKFLTMIEYYHKNKLHSTHYPQIKYINGNKTAKSLLNVITSKYDDDIDTIENISQILNYETENKNILQFQEHIKNIKRKDKIIIDYDMIDLHLKNEMSNLINNEIPKYVKFYRLLDYIIYCIRTYNADMLNFLLQYYKVDKKDEHKVLNLCIDTDNLDALKILEPIFETTDIDSLLKKSIIENSVKCYKYLTEKFNCQLDNHNIFLKLISEIGLSDDASTIILNDIIKNNKDVTEQFKDNFNFNNYSSMVLFLKQMKNGNLTFVNMLKDKFIDHGFAKKAELCNINAILKFAPITLIEELKKEDQDILSEKLLSKIHFHKIDLEENRIIQLVHALKVDYFELATCIMPIYGNKLFNLLKEIFSNISEYIIENKYSYLYEILLSSLEIFEIVISKGLIPDFDDYINSILLLTSDKRISNYIVNNYKLNSEDIRPTLVMEAIKMVLNNPILLTNVHNHLTILLDKLISYNVNCTTIVEIITHMLKEEPQQEFYRTILLNLINDTTKSIDNNMLLKLTETFNNDQEIMNSLKRRPINTSNAI